MSWKKDLRSSISTLEKLKQHISLTKEEEQWFQNRKEMALPFRISPYYLSLIKKNNLKPINPIRIQAIPSINEMNELSIEKTDPLFESSFSPIEGMIHRYPSRVLLLAGDRCAMYCRHCFRRHHTGQEGASHIQKQLPNIVKYIEQHPEICEVLISGGDPLLSDDKELLNIINPILQIRPDLIIRLGTRTPVTLPSRITPKLVRLLKKSKRIWLITQFNHPDEMTVKSYQAVNKLIQAGIPVLNQTVLLRNVNNNVKILKLLSNMLVRWRIKPYYIFQGDLAAGTAHLRVPLQESFQLIKALRKELSGLAMPVFAVDLPGGGGKVPLTENYLIKTDESGFHFKSLEGKKFIYPDESIQK